MLKWLRRVLRISDPCDLCGQDVPTKLVNHESRWADGHYERMFRSCDTCWEKDDYPFLVDAFFERTGNGVWVPNRSEVGL